jgi:hypothetical protein
MAAQNGISSAVENDRTSKREQSMGCFGSAQFRSMTKNKSESEEDFYEQAAFLVLCGLMERKNRIH